MNVSAVWCHGYMLNASLDILADDLGYLNIYVPEEREEEWIKKLGFTKGFENTRSLTDFARLGLIRSFTWIPDHNTADQKPSQLSVSYDRFEYKPSNDPGERLYLRLFIRNDVSYAIAIFTFFDLAHSITR